MRGECWRAARSAPGGAAYVQLHVACPLETALQRNAARPLPNRVPEEVLRRTAAAFEDPGASPCPWDKNTISADLLDISEIWAKIWEVWGAPLPPPADEEAEAARVAAARAATAADAVHAADVATRQLLTAALSLLDGLSSDQKAAVARELNAERRRVLEEAGRGDVAAAAAAFRKSCEAICAAHGVDIKLT
jgi:tRNA uridine 5-carbamoylmethylation protein Kti12